MQAPILRIVSLSRTTTYSTGLWPKEEGAVTDQILSWMQSGDVVLKDYISDYFDGAKDAAQWMYDYMRADPGTYELYAIGELEILDIENEARDADDFDLKDIVSKNVYQMCFSPPYTAACTRLLPIMHA